MGRPRFDLPARPERVDRALREHRCWMCGDHLGAMVTFLTEPHWVVQGFAGEPPCHRECAVYAAENCRYFVHAIGRPVLCLWTCRQYARIKSDNAVVIRISGATDVRWYFGGKPATRTQVTLAFSAAMPKLRAMVGGDLAAKSELERSLTDIMLRHVPK
jgi:hypothetical protein